MFNPPYIPLDIAQHTLMGKYIKSLYLNIGFRILH